MGAILNQSLTGTSCRVIAALKEYNQFWRAGHLIKFWKPNYMPMIFDSSGEIFYLLPNKVHFSIFCDVCAIHVIISDQFKSKLPHKRNSKWCEKLCWIILTYLLSAHEAIFCRKLVSWKRNTTLLLSVLSFSQQVNESNSVICSSECDKISRLPVFYVDEKFTHQVIYFNTKSSIFLMSRWKFTHQVYFIVYYIVHIGWSSFLLWYQVSYICMECNFSLVFTTSSKEL